MPYTSASLVWRVAARLANSARTIKGIDEVAKCLRWPLRLADHSLNLGYVDEMEAHPPKASYASARSAIIPILRKQLENFTKIPNFNMR